jgi:hypothetical protein
LDLSQFKPPYRGMGYNLQAADDLMLGKGPLELRQVSPEHMALVIGQVVGVWGRHFDEVEAVCFLKSKSRRQPNFHSVYTACR